MLHASGIIHQAKLDNNFDDMQQFHQLKLSAFSIFQKIEDTEGQAEVIFLWAMLLIMDQSSDHRGKAISGSPQANSFEPSAFRDNFGSITSDGKNGLANMLVGHK